jgi:hypothetical protein
MVAAVNEQRAALGEAPLPPPERSGPALGRASVTAVRAAVDTGREPLREAMRTATRFLLDSLAERAPGRAVEVRVPPYAAVQCVAGPRHTRGTPPNVIETDPLTWLDLATGRLDWAAAVATGKLRVSGPRADVSEYLPLVRLRPGH